MEKETMENESDILIRKAITLVSSQFPYEHSNETISNALQELYNKLEKRFYERNANLLSVNKQLQKEIADHIQAEYALYYRAEFAKLIANVSINLLKLPRRRIHRKIRNALHAIGEFVGVDRSYLFLFSGERKKIGDVYEWCAKGIGPQTENLQGHLVNKEFPWLAKKIKRHGLLYLHCCNSLPPEADVEKAYFHLHGIKSLVAVPMFYGRACIGCVGFDSVREEKTWGVDIIVMLRIVGQIFSSVLGPDWKEKTSMAKEKNNDCCSNRLQMEPKFSTPFDIAI